MTDFAPRQNYRARPRPFSEWDSGFACGFLYAIGLVVLMLIGILL